MKIVLLEDVKTLGKKGDIVEVSPGYARNKILPQKLGIEATPKALNDLKLQEKHVEKVAKEHLEAAQELASKIEDQSVTLAIKTGEGGRTFGSVSTKEIAIAVKEQLGFEIDKKKMVLPEAIKTLGVTEVPMKLHPNVIAKLKVKVIEKE